MTGSRKSEFGAVDSFVWDCYILMISLSLKNKGALLPRPAKQTTGLVSVRMTMIDPGSIAFDQESVCRTSIIVTAKVPHNSESGSFFGWADVVHIRQGSRCPVTREQRKFRMKRKMIPEPSSGTPVTPLLRQLSAVVFISGRTGALH